jgi:hypothetical protein
MTHDLAIRCQLMGGMGWKNLMKKPEIPVI